MGRSELVTALKSVAAQTYRPIEILLVDARGGDSPLLDPGNYDVPIDIVSTGLPLNRSAAANAGMSAASGQYLMFLDEDDWISPDHISSLVDFLASHREVQAAYCQTRLTTPDGKLTTEKFAQSFDPILLMRDNYIPIHAMLFERRLYEAGCKFDQQFDIYEDWDFWLQLLRQTNFGYLEHCSAFYRAGGESDTALSDERQRYNQEHKSGITRSMLYEKWMPVWSGKDLNSLLGLMDQTESIRKLDATIDDLHSQLSNMNDSLNATTDEKLRLEHTLQDTSQRLQQKENHLDHARKHAEQLQHEISRIFQSKSWRFTAPFRKIHQRVVGIQPDDSQSSNSQ